MLISGNSIIGGVDWNETKMNSLHYEIAANFQQRITKNHTLFLTAVLEPEQKLNATKNAYLFYGNVDDPQLLDTLSSSKNVKTSVYLAQRTQFGMAYKIRFKDSRKDNSLRNSEIALHVNYTKSQTLSDTISSITVNQPQGWNLGFQYTPEIGFQDNSTNMKFHEKLF